jgi:hypothetical protein
VSENPAAHGRTHTPKPFILIHTPKPLILIQEYSGGHQEKDVVEERCRVDHHITLYTLVVNHVTLKRNIRIVIVLDQRTPDKPRYVVLSSTDCKLAATMIFSYYAARFQIEFLFRDAKQFTGLTDCQARDQKALHFHLNAALTAVNIAKIEQMQQSGKVTPQVFSLSSYKQRAFNEHLLELFISKLALRADLIKNHPQYNYLRNYGAIAA